MLLAIEGPHALVIFFYACSDLLWLKNEIEQMPDKQSLLPVRHDRNAVVKGNGRTAVPGALPRWFFSCICNFLSSACISFHLSPNMCVRSLGQKIVVKSRCFDVTEGPENAQICLMLSSQPVRIMRFSLNLCMDTVTSSCPRVKSHLRCSVIKSISEGQMRRFISWSISIHIQVEFMWDLWNPINRWIGNLPICCRRGEEADPAGKVKMMYNP